MFPTYLTGLTTDAPVASTGDMTKAKLAMLDYLTRVPDAPAAEVASALHLTLPAASMALLRLVRSGLATRAWDRARQTHFYSITTRGRARVEFFAARRA